VIVIPAIDVRRGRVVRLLRGRPQDETAYATDPAETAAGFAAQGARWVHVVDLDAALGTGTNREAVGRAVEAAGVPAQVGGGLRSVRNIEEVLGLAAARVILGTVAVADQRFLAEAVERFGDRVAVAVDTDGRDVLVRGWTEGAGPLEDVVARLEAAGAPRLLVTAVHRDGTLRGPDEALYRRLARLTDRPVMASGGVASSADLRVLAGTGVDAAVVGRALYEGALRLEEAMEAAEVPA
jgi:phosphoribosylformimino-5-aminoimidazole carboxamide ribotide isomerase